ncbi:hypothetical protein J3E71DRAFT_236440 [Bipolaris maydis]|nr:hypothetical protein J3E71DRAFT_236440 [Bipolaris maydis]
MIASAKTVLYVTLFCQLGFAYDHPGMAWFCAADTGNTATACAAVNGAFMFQTHEYHYGAYRYVEYHDYCCVPNTLEKTLEFYDACWAQNQQAPVTDRPQDSGGGDLPACG